MNTDICLEKRDLYDSNGVYLQTACVNDKIQTYSEAEATCQANGMDMFDISSAASQTALIDYGNAIFHQGSGYYFHVKRQSPDDCKFLDNEAGSFELQSTNCDRPMYSFCGFVDPALEQVSLLDSRKST